MDSYYTLKAGEVIKAEIVEKKSRFIAHITHVKSEQEAEAFIQSIRAQHRDARHNVPAFVLADGTMRCSDDGEPQRTSGFPVLELLCKENYKDVCVVVTRYFGGVLLGPGGLKRAYTAAAQASLEKACTQELRVTMTCIIPVDVTCSYALYDKIAYVCEKAGAHILSVDYTDIITMHLSMLPGVETDLAREICEISSDSACVDINSPEFGVF